MKLLPRPRVIASFAAAATLIVSCGGGTAEVPQPTSAAPAPTAAPPTQAAVQLPKTLILVGDTVRGTKNLTDEEKPFLGCVQTNRFPPESQIVWRYKVIDPLTTKPMGDKEIKSFKVTLPDNTTADFKYGEHPKGSNIWFWTTSFVIPKGYPTGAFTYKVLATDGEGRTGTFEQFNVASAMLQVIPAGSR